MTTSSSCRSRCDPPAPGPRACPGEPSCFHHHLRHDYSLSKLPRAKPPEVRPTCSRTSCRHQRFRASRLTQVPRVYADPHAPGPRACWRTAAIPTRRPHRSDPPAFTPLLSALWLQRRPTCSTTSRMAAYGCATHPPPPCPPSIPFLSTLGYIGALPSIGTSSRRAMDPSAQGSTCPCVAA